MIQVIIKRLLILTSDTVITKETLLVAAPHMEDGGKREDENLSEIISSEVKYLLGPGDAEGSVYEIILKKIEKPLIQSILQVTKGNKKKAAQVLGINRNTLSKKIDELGLNVQEDD